MGLTSQQDKTGKCIMIKKLFKVITIAMLFMSSTIVNAQYEDFILQNKYKGFETKDDKGYVEIAIRDSTNIDSYITAIYSTLVESYPDAEIQTIGNRGLRMYATSNGIAISKLDIGDLKLFVDFSIMIDVREHPDKICYYVDSLGVRRPYNDYHHVRIYAPVVIKLTAYNPYYHPEVKEYITKKEDMYETLMEKTLYGNGSNAEEFIGEIYLYIISNIRAELNQRYYRTWENGRFAELARKIKR